MYSTDPAATCEQQMPGAADEDASVLGHHAGVEEGKAAVEMLHLALPPLRITNNTLTYCSHVNVLGRF